MSPWGVRESLFSLYTTISPNIPTASCFQGQFVAPAWMLSVTSTLAPRARQNCTSVACSIHFLRMDQQESKRLGLTMTRHWMAGPDEGAGTSPPHLLEEFCQFHSLASTSLLCFLGTTLRKYRLLQVTQVGGFSPNKCSQFKIFHQVSRSISGSN